MTKKAHKKYLDKIHIDPDNPDNCTLQIKCPCVEQKNCCGCDYTKKGIKE